MIQAAGTRTGGTFPIVPKNVETALKFAKDILWRQAMTRNVPKFNRIGLIATDTTVPIYRQMTKIVSIQTGLNGRHVVKVAAAVQNLEQGHY